MREGGEGERLEKEIGEEGRGREGERERGRERECEAGDRGERKIFVYKHRRTNARTHTHT